MSFPAASSGQRFMPLQHATAGYAKATVSAPTGMRTSGGRPVTARPTGQYPIARAAAPTGPDTAGSNVVQLRPTADRVGGYEMGDVDAAFGGEPRDDRAFQQAWQAERSSRFGMPTSTVAARERRRHVLFALTGVAFATLLLALFSGGAFVALHVFVDAAMLAYVILLVRHRQLEAERRFKIEPIRPPVTEQAPAYVQVAPSYLLQSGTGT